MPDHQLDIEIKLIKSELKEMTERAEKVVEEALEVITQYEIAKLMAKDPMEELLAVSSVVSLLHRLTDSRALPLMCRCSQYAVEVMPTNSAASPADDRGNAIVRQHCTVGVHREA